MACPPVNINYPEITEKIEGLNKAALPYRMTLAPVRMINDNDRKINVYDIEECKKGRDQIRKKNTANISIICRNYNDNFNKKYDKSFNKYFGEVNKTYYGSALNDICDTFTSNYWDSRKMENLYDKTNLNFTELYYDCLEFFRFLYLEIFHGDKEKTLAHIDSSKLMRELIYYHKTLINPPRVRIRLFFRRRLSRVY